MEVLDFILNNFISIFLISLYNKNSLVFFHFQCDRFMVPYELGRLSPSFPTYVPLLAFSRTCIMNSEEVSVTFVIN